MKFINVTPHNIVMNSGEVFETSGIIARVTSSFSDPDQDGLVTEVYGQIENLPSPQEGIRYIVSAIVLSAAVCQGRTDCVAPATGHPLVVRNDKGHILSVPFLRK